MPSRAGSQNSQFGAALELDVGRKRLVVAASSGATTTLPLRSRGRLGLFAYLVHARRSDREHGAKGFRSAAEIVAEAPGWTGVSDVRSVGKQFSRLAGESSVVEEIVEAPNGICVGPWRLRTEERDVRVANELALLRVLHERADVPRTSVRNQRSGSTDARPAPALDLEDARLLIARGGDPEHLREKLRRDLMRAASSSDPETRAKVALLEAMLLRREGRLGPAERRARDALAWYEAQPASDQLGLAGALNELGAVAYRRAKFEDARAFFEQERATLANQASPTARVALARALRCLALTSLRLRELEAGLRSATAAERAAEETGDEVATWLARAVELRLVAARGGLQDAPYAMDHLLRAAMLAPVVDPWALLFIRRLYLETLFLLGDHEVDAIQPEYRAITENRVKASELALAIVRDALAIGSARDVDAVAKLLRRYRQKEVLAQIPRGHRVAARDGIEDWEFLNGAWVETGRRPRRPP